jgi:hypothetical protein
MKQLTSPFFVRRTLYFLVKLKSLIIQIQPIQNS